MTDKWMGLICVLAAVLVEAFAQLFLKQGAEHPAGAKPLALLRYAWRNKWVLVAWACFIIEAGLWTLALRLLPMSVAFPAGSISFVFVALLSRIWLKEQVSLTRWIGMGLILIGVALIGLQ